MSVTLHNLQQTRPTFYCSVHFLKLNDSNKNFPSFILIPNVLVCKESYGSFKSLGASRIFQIRGIFIPAFDWTKIGHAYECKMSLKKKRYILNAFTC